jgi:hypothetical protein
MKTVVGTFIRFSMCRPCRELAEHSWQIKLTCQCLIGSQLPSSVLAEMPTGIAECAHYIILYDLLLLYTMLCCWELAGCANKWRHTNVRIVMDLFCLSTSIIYLLLWSSSASQHLQELILMLTAELLLTNVLTISELFLCCSLGDVFFIIIDTRLFR